MSDLVACLPDNVQLGDEMISRAPLSIPAVESIQVGPVSARSIGTDPCVVGETLLDCAPLAHLADAKCVNGSVAEEHHQKPTALPVKQDEWETENKQSAARTGGDENSALLNSSAPAGLDASVSRNSPLLEEARVSEPLLTECMMCGCVLVSQPVSVLHSHAASHNDAPRFVCTQCPLLATFRDDVSARLHFDSRHHYVAVQYSNNQLDAEWSRVWQACFPSLDTPARTAQPADSSGQQAATPSPKRLRSDDATPTTTTDDSQMRDVPSAAGARLEPIVAPCALPGPAGVDAVSIARAPAPRDQHASLRRPTLAARLRLAAVRAAVWRVISGRRRRSTA